MNNIFDSFINGVEIGELQRNGALAMLPILANLPAELDYLTLQEAIAEKVITITELSEGGSVPELAVDNVSKMPILLLDGEELAGAKQNRVVNTTILLKESSKTIIPVSCVEHGRWRYDSHEFRDSGNIMAAKQRERKGRAVSFNLASSGRRNSNQSDVWAGVEEMACKFSVESDTGAMKDVFEHVGGDLTSLLKAFAPIPGQRGMVIFIDGKITGIEYISQSRAFILVFEKLLRSYAMDALDIRKPSTSDIDKSQVTELLTSLSNGIVKSYDAIGYGTEHRVNSNISIGSALTVHDTLIHLTLLAADKDRTNRDNDEDEEYTTSSRRRRREYNHRLDVPFPRSYWVQPEQLLAGCYPGAPERPMAAHKLSELLDAGIRCVINLMEPEETDYNGQLFSPYEEQLAAMASERGIRIQCLRIPIPDQCVPTHETMRQILNAIDAAMADRMPTYIHCWGGKGRTGTVVGCWMARHGIANGQEALDRVQYLRRNDPTASQPSPENRIQCNMVKNWRQGE